MTTRHLFFCRDKKGDKSYTVWTREPVMLNGEHAPVSTHTGAWNTQRSVRRS